MVCAIESSLRVAAQTETLKDNIMDILRQVYYYYRSHLRLSRAKEILSFYGTVLHVGIC
jgi:hypothetical protein